LWDGETAGTAKAEIQLRTSQDGIAFTDWQPFKLGTYNFKDAQFRLRLFTDNIETNVFVTRARIIADVADRREEGNIITSAVGNTTVTFNRPYVIPPPNGIGYVIQDGSTEDQVTISNITKDGFTINIYQASNRIAREIYWFTESY
jgi:hypothetical protein